MQLKEDPPVTQQVIVTPLPSATALNLFSLPASSPAQPTASLLSGPPEQTSQMDISVRQPVDSPTKEALTKPNISTLSGKVMGLLKGKVVEKTIDAAEMEVRFHLTYFLRAFIVHIAYYTVLGPFTALICVPIVGWTLFLNMQFFNGRNAFLQNGLWVCNIVTILIYFLYPSNEIVDLMFMMALNTVLRVSVISTRYGYTSPYLFELMRSVDLRKRTEIRNDLALGGLLVIIPSEIDKEVKAAMWRAHIVPEEFQLHFADKMPQVLSDRLSQEDYPLPS